MSVQARFVGRCSECDGMVNVGERIVPDSRQDGVAWMHEWCPPGRLDIVREVCPECFTEKSVTGACMCPEAS